jgi:uncharacterized protein YndB with AHSA1/START domain
MPVEPTGSVRETETGIDLTVDRYLQAPIADVWSSVTESGRTALWFGPWEGDGRPGGRVVVTLTAEDGQPTSHLEVVACEPPHRLEVSMHDEHGVWDLEIRLERAGSGTIVRLVHHLASRAGLGDVGPGWEFYLDRLAASRVDGPMPDFEAYYPGMREYYEALQPTPPHVA